MNEYSVLRKFLISQIHIHQPNEYIGIIYILKKKLHNFFSMWIAPSSSLKGYPVQQVGQVTVGEAPDPPEHFILDGAE